MRAVLDACVLYPTVLREILMGFAARGLYEPLFSDRILREWTRAALKLGPAAQLVAEGEAALTRAAFPRALIREDQALEARLDLPDPADLHVLGTAITGHADRIITFNARDFPRPVLADFGLIRQDPDQLSCELAARHPAEVRAVVTAVLATAERLSGAAIGLSPLLKRAQLRRLARMLTN